MPRKKIIESVLEPEQPIVTQVEPAVKKPRAKKVTVQPVEIPLTPEPEPVKRKSTPKPRKQSKWMTALKEYNKTTAKYTIPKKGTSEYDEVQRLMESMTV